MPRSSWLQLSVILLASCGMGEASPTQVQAKQEHGPLRAMVRSEEENPEDCRNHEKMRLTVLDGTREVATRTYCSAYNLGEARVVTDATGKSYVLLQYGQGHGTRATTMYLTIYEFRNFLDERARVPIQEPVGVEADIVYEYAIATPAGGGIVLDGSWQVRGQLRPGERAPVRRGTVLGIDTAAEAP